MKILYGVVGEGMGHAMRSSVLLDHLTSEGHDMRITVSGRAASYLAERHPGKVTEITGLTMVYEDNIVKKLRTAIANLKAAVGVPDNIGAYIETWQSFQPDVVISDFESWSYAFARAQMIPVISIDNMQVIARCQHDEDLITDKKAYLLAKGIVKAKLPNANAYLITTFFRPPVKKPRTTLHPPILRKVILDAKAQVRTGEHVLVYQSAVGHDALAGVLSEAGVPFRIYGMRRDLDAPQTEGNLTYCPFSEDGFIEDLATARAVIAGGGFTLMGEALFLGKPVLSVPLVGQFEQALNAAYLQKLGYGEQTAEITGGLLRSFLEQSPMYAQNLAGFEHDQNVGLFAALTEAMDDAVRDGPII